MNPWAQFLLMALGVGARATQNQMDDKVAEALTTLMTKLDLSGKPSGLQIAEGVLAALEPWTEQADWTGAEKLRGELAEVVASLKRVVGSDVYRAQLAAVEIEWPYLDAPGVARGAAGTGVEKAKPE